MAKRNEAFILDRFSVQTLGSGQSPEPTEGINREHWSLLYSPLHHRSIQER